MAATTIEEAAAQDLPQVELPTEASEMLEELQAQKAWQTPEPLSEDQPAITDRQRELVRTYHETDIAPGKFPDFESLLKGWISSSTKGADLAVAFILGEIDYHYTALILEELGLSAKVKIGLINSLSAGVHHLINQVAPIAIEFGIELPESITQAPAEESDISTSLDATAEDDDTDAGNYEGDVVPVLEGELV